MSVADRVGPPTDQSHESQTIASADVHTKSVAQKEKDMFFQKGRILRIRFLDLYREIEPGHGQLRRLLAPYSSKRERKPLLTNLPCQNFSSQIQQKSPKSAKIVKRFVTNNNP